MQSKTPHDSATEEQVFQTPSDPKIFSRREALGVVPKVAAGAAVATTLVGTVGTLTACGDSDKGNGSGTPDVLQVSDDQVVTLDAYEQVEDPASLYKVETIATIKQPCTIHSSDGKVAALLLTNETASPLNSLGLLNLETGAYNVVLPEAEGASEGFSFLDVRGNSKMIMWVESNYLTGDWRVYSASVKSKEGLFAISSSTRLDEGDAEFDAPEIAVVKSQPYWIVQPAENGTKTSEDSLLKCGGGTACTSHGRFNGGLSVSGSVVCAMPRAESSSSKYYQLSAFSGSGLIDSITMPRAFRPTGAIYMDGKFAFGIPAKYDYGDGISNMGTYYPLDEGRYLRLIRQPVTVPGLCAGWLFCKSGARTVFVDRFQERYFVITPPEGSADYGDYTVQYGTTKSVIVYATVTKIVDNEPKKQVVVRRITLEEIG